MNIVPESATNATLPAPKETLELKTPVSQKLSGAHPLEARVTQWDDAQTALKMQVLGRNYGAGEPIRRAMELHIVENSGFVPHSLGGPSNVHRDILTNKDGMLAWEDVHQDESELSFHQEMASRMDL